MFRYYKTAILTLVSLFSIGFISIIGLSSTAEAFDFSLNDDQRIDRYKNKESLDNTDKKRAEILIHILDTCKVSPVAPVSQTRNNPELTKIMNEMADKPGATQAALKPGGDANRHFYATANRVDDQGNTVNYLYKFPRTKPGGDTSYNNTSTATWRNTCLDKIKEFGQSSNQLVAAAKAETERLQAEAGARVLYDVLCPSGGSGSIQEQIQSQCRDTVRAAAAVCSSREIYVEGQASRAPTAAETRQCIRQQLQGKVSDSALILVTDGMSDQFNRAVAGVEEVKPAGGEEEHLELEEGESTTTCSISGVGWIVCPIMTFMGFISDAAYGAIENFLSVNTSIMDTNTGTYEAWTVFRNIANAAFIVVFLIIIYSQITGAGLSSYGVKKMLPRLLVGAVLVNISFFITQLMVDITQIMGATLKDLLIEVNATSGGNDPSPHSAADIAQGALIGALAGGAAVAGGAILLTSITAPVLLAFVIAVLMTVVILIGRQAAIVMLVVLSPLAFVAYLLPNTESLFKKWLKIFWSLLLLYPIVALLYGGGNLAGRILNNAGASGTGADSTWLQITALGVTAIPLIMTPFVLRGALNATGKFGAKLSGMGQKAQSRVGSKVKETSRFGEAQRGIASQLQRRRAQRRVNSKFARRLDNSRLGRAIGLDKGAAAAAASVAKTKNDDIENAAIIMQEQEGWTAATAIPMAQKELKDAIANGDATRARAAQKILLQSGSKGISAAADTLSDNVNSSNVGSSTVQLLKADITSAGLKGKDAALDQWSRETSAITVDQVARGGALKSLTDMEYAGQSAARLASANLPQDRARDIKRNQNVWANLSADKKTIVEMAAAGQDTSQLVTSPSQAQKEAIAESLRRSSAPPQAPTPAQPTPQPAPAQPPQPGPGNTPGTPPQTPGGTPPAAPGGPTGP